MKISEVTAELNQKRVNAIGKVKSLLEKIPQNKYKRISDRFKTLGIVLYLYRFFLFFPLSIIYMEIVFKISIFKTVFDSGFHYMILFSIPAGLFLYILSTFSKRKINRIVSIALTGVVTLMYMVQVVYYQVFTTFFALFSLNGAGQVLQFWREIFIAIGNNIVSILFLLVPLLFIIILGNRLIPPDKTALSFKGIIAGIIVVFQFLTTVGVYNSNSGDLSAHFLYSDAIIPDLSVGRFGLLTTSRLDLKHLVFGFEAEDQLIDEDNTDLSEGAVSEPSKEAWNPTSAPASNSTDTAINSNGAGTAAENTVQPGTQNEFSQYNVMNIDFDSLIAGETDPDVLAMHKYFKNVKPTNKNKYTGMFKGKNLIFITAEGFSPYAVNKDLTPTLYRMQQEGFRFTNFYTPIWGVSTSDGEYVACNSLVPKSGVWSFYVSGRNYMPFVMGNQLKKLGYSTRAYHDHSYTYYHRDVSHPNMGYDFKAVGHGLDMTKSWPESDIEMMQKTTDEYINDKPFHTYYMTVSGHLQYTFGGNAMASKNKDFVKDLKYSEHVKAYLACQIELDRAMGELISRLEKAGVAEDTLIAVSPDHYPYGLTVDELSELAGHKIEENFELYKGIFLLWSKGMKSETIDKPCASMDILPTLSNLIGVEYDSRLLMGRDIFSEASPLIVFSNWSWLTDKAKYNSKQRKLILAKGETEETVTKKYKAEIAREVNSKFTFSTKILDTNYYAKVFK